MADVKLTKFRANWEEYQHKGEAFRTEHWTAFIEAVDKEAAWDIWFDKYSDTPNNGLESLVEVV